MTVSNSIFNICVLKFNNIYLLFSLRIIEDNESELFNCPATFNKLCLVLQDEVRFH